MKALVTGAGGFLGAHLAARLVADGWDVAGTVRPGAAGGPERPPERGGGPERPPERGGGPERPPERGGGPPGVELLPVDLADPVATAEAAGRVDPDVVFLLAAARAAITPAERASTVAVNASSGAWLVDGLGDRCRAVVRLGSSTEYAAADGPLDETSPLRPRGFFGATKAAGSLLVAATAAARGIRATVLRAFQVYGPEDHPARLVPTALRAARSGEVLPLTGPGLRRDWIYVDDVVEACVRAALADDLPPGQILNVGTGRQVANEELVAMVEQVSGRPVRIAVGAHLGRSWDTGSWVCDPSLAADLLGWEAKVTIEDGLGRCWDAVR